MGACAIYGSNCYIKNYKIISFIVLNDKDTSCLSVYDVYHLDRGSGPSISVNAGQELITLGWVAPRFSTNGYGFYA